MSFFRVTTPRAAKPYHCEECRAPIAVGDRYSRLNWYEPEGPAVFTATICLRCQTMRSLAWDVFDWWTECAPGFGELRDFLRTEHGVADPEAWLDERLAQTTAAHALHAATSEAVRAYQMGGSA
jgi:hypothetical protein